MSTLKSINVVHPSSAVNNIVNDASGNVAIGNNLTVAGTATLTGATTVGGVAVVAVAPSTNGNVLTSNGTAWTSAASTASLTLLATLTTTSGTTQSATGLATTYKNLLIVYEGVGNSTSTGDNLLIKASSTNGAAYGTTIGAASSSPAYGAQFIWRANSSLANHPATNALRTALADSLCVLPTTTAAPINALQFSWATGYTFNAGTIYIYGWN